MKTNKKLTELINERIYYNELVHELDKRIAKEYRYVVELANEINDTEKELLPTMATSIEVVVMKLEELQTQKRVRAEIVETVEKLTREIEELLGMND